jgi:chromosome segregation ATPase
MSARLTLALALALSASLPAQEKITYADHARAALENKCFSCHNPDKKKGDLDLTTYAGTMAGGGGGAVVDPGNPDGSRLILTCTKKEEPFMPPEGPGLSSVELDVLRKWIAGGVLDTASSVAKKSNKPKVDLNVAAGAGKPTGPIARPEHVLLEPVVVTPRTTAVTALAASPWTNVVAVAAPKQILLYDTDTRQLAGVFPYQEGYARSLQFSASGALLVVGGGRGGKFGHAVVFDVKSGKRVAEVGKEPDSVMSADISPDHSKVVIGCTGKKVKCYDLASGEELYAIAKHTEWVLATDFSPDGILLASADRNGNVFVWEADNGGEFFLLGQHKDTPCVDVAWRSDSNVLASIGKDGTLILWEMNEGKQLKTWKAQDTGAEAVAFTPDGNILTTGASGSVKLWDVNGNAKGKIESATGMMGTDIVGLSDGKACIAADWQGNVRKISLEGGNLVQTGELSSNPQLIVNRIGANEKLAAELAAKVKPSQDAVAKAQADAQALNAELAKVKEEAGAAEGRKNNLPGEIKNAQNDLAATKAQREKLGKDKEARAAQVAQFAQKKQALTALEGQLAPLAGDVAKFAAANQAYEAAKAAVEAAQKELAAKPGDAALDAKVKDLSTKLAAATAEQAKLAPNKTKADQLTAQITKAKAELGNDPGNPAEFDKPMAEADAKIKALNDSIAAKNKEVPQIAEVLKGFPNRIKDAETKVNAANAAVSQAQQSAKVIADDLAIAQRQVPSLKAAQFNVGVLSEKEKLEKLESDFQAFTDGLKENEDAKAADQKAIEDGNKAIAEANAAQAGLDAAFQQQVKELDPVEKTAAASKAAADTAGGKVNEQKGIISGAEGKIAALVKTRDEAKANAVKLEAEIDKQVQAQKPVIEAAKKKAEAPQKLIADRQAAAQKAEEVVAAALKAAADAKAAFEQKTAAVKTLETAVTSAQAAKDSAQKDLPTKRQPFDRATAQLKGQQGATPAKEKALADAKAANKPEAAALEKELADHKTKVAAAEAEIAVIKGVFEVAQKLVEEKTHAHAEAGKTFQAAKNEAGKALAAQKTAEQELKNKQNQLTNAKNQVAAAEKQAAPLIAAVAAAEEKITKARAAREVHRLAPAKLDGEFNANSAPLNKQIADAKAALPALEKTLADTTGVATKDAQARDAKRDIVGKAQAAAEGNKKKKADAEASIAKATKDIPERDKNIAEAKAELAKLQPQLDPARGKVKQLTEQYFAMLPK